MITSTPTCTHATHFAGIDGKLSYESIMEGQKKWGITGNLAHIRALAVLKMCGEDKTPESLSQVVNHARSGIWNTDGTFNEDRFNELKEHTVLSDDGVEVITQSIFDKFLSKLHGNGFSGIMVNVWISSIICLPITYHQVTQGSVAEFFDKFSDSTYKEEKAVSLDKLRQFYTDPEAAGREVETKYCKI